MNPKEKARQQAEEAVEKTAMVEEVVRLAGFEATVRELDPAGWKLRGVYLAANGDRRGHVVAEQWPLIGLWLTVFPEADHERVPFYGTAFHLKLARDTRPVWGSLPQGVLLPTVDEAWDLYREGRERYRIEEIQSRSLKGNPNHE